MASLYEGPLKDNKMASKGFVGKKLKKEAPSQAQRNRKTKPKKV